jgi:hypothetical protein
MTRDCALSCDERSLVSVQVQQSAHAQLQKLDALTRRLEALNAPSQSPEVQAQDMKHGPTCCTI